MMRVSPVSAVTPVAVTDVEVPSFVAVAVAGVDESTPVVATHT